MAGAVIFHIPRKEYPTWRSIWYCWHWRPSLRTAVLEAEDEQVACRFERHLKSGSGRAFAKGHFG
jgi:hypothetical protein